MTVGRVRTTGRLAGWMDIISGGGTSELVVIGSTMAICEKARPGRWTGQDHGLRGPRPEQKVARRLGA